MITGGEPPHGDFIAYLERIVGTPPSTPEEIIRLARAVSSGKASASASANTEMVKPASAADTAAELTPRAKPALPKLAIGDADLALLAPIGRGLTVAGFAVLAAAIFLGPWLPLPSPITGVALIFLGVILRRVGRGAMGTGRQARITRRS